MVIGHKKLHDVSACGRCRFFYSCCFCRSWIERRRRFSILPDATSKCAPGDTSNCVDAPAPPAVDRSDSIRMACNVDERIEPILKPNARCVAEYATRIGERRPGPRHAQRVTANRVAFMNSLNTKPSDTAAATPPHQSATNHSQPGNLRRAGA
ncbi:hypothetical protein [Paraburkholderia sp. BL10I2N1]|uniref:hypothetical protein n=1 Tax=Paraburkholderia sp. BL10I2N1 TaxID=1938796 RepID=UPI001414F640|nr:hypothetical protein [Paraburkholderia sp. BL10I2N1]